MAELFDLVETDARSRAQSMGYTVQRVISTTIARIDTPGAPRWRIARQTVNNDSIHSEIIDNCGLTPISRAISFQEQRHYSLSVELDTRLRATAQGMMSLVEFIQIPQVSGSTATQQGTVTIDVTLGAAMRGQQTSTKTYRDDTSFQVPPCTRTSIDYRVRNRTLSGTVEIDLRVIAVVVVELRLDTSAGQILFALGLPVDLQTTATGTFAGLVADEMRMQNKQVACREGLCGMLSDEQLGQRWGLDGAPQGPIPTEFPPPPEEMPLVPNEPPGMGMCYSLRECTGNGYESLYRDCHFDPDMKSWKGPDGTCHRIR